MKSPLPIGLILIVFFLSQSIAFAIGDNPWLAFIKDPNESNYTTCSHQISVSTKGIATGKYETMKSISFLQLMESWESKRKYPNVFGKLLLLIQKGNNHAISLGFQLYPILENCPYCVEDLNVFLGMLIKNYPLLFLENFKKYRGQIIHLEGLLGNHGDEYVDKMDLRIKETQMRINALQKIQRDDLSAVRDECVEKLYKNYESLSTIPIPK